MPDTLIATRYRLVSTLGRGGMGVVWEAYDELLQRSVAVKEVQYPAGVSAAERDRLAAQTLREARAVAAIDTSAAVRVYDIVEQDSKPWLVMELVRGRTLTDLLRERGGLPSAEVARIGLVLLTALEAAHGAGVLHRDVKPSNVLVGDDGRIALTDFGIATVDSDPSETTSGVIVGSPSYVAPERAQGARPTPASDLWSLGATLWTAAEGRAPYDGPTAFVVMSAVANDEPPPCTQCDPALRDLLSAMMSRSPTKRPAPARIRSALDQVARTSTTSATQRTAVLDRAFDRTTVLPSAAPVTAGAGAVAAGAGAVAAGSGSVSATSPPLPAASTLAPAVPEERPPAAPRPPRPEAPRRPDHGRPSRRTFGLTALGIAAVGAAVAAGFVVAGGGNGPSTPSAAAHHSHRAKTSASAPASPSASASTGPASTAVPAGFRRYHDPQYGWSVAVPRGWTVSDQSASRQFTDPAGGRYVQFGTRYPAGSSAIGAWQSEEKTFESQHAAYHRLRMQTISVPGAKDAADWEFTYTDSGASLHALDRGMVFGTRGYGIYFQTHTDQWASSAGLLNTMIRTFRAGRTGA